MSDELVRNFTARKTKPDVSDIQQILRDAELRINKILLETSQAINLPIEAETHDISTYGNRGPASIVALRVTVRP